MTADLRSAVLQRAPMSWSLPRSPEAASLARRHLRQAAAETPAEVLELAQLLVTELVANALQHGSGPVTLRLLPRRSGIRVEVRDAGAGLPRLRTPSPLDTGGRGLQIVDALAAAWGATPESAQGGKTVWFEVIEPPSVDS